MTRKYVTDDQYGQLKRRMDELARRVDEGTIPFDHTMRALQHFIEGKFRFGGEQKEFPFKVWKTIKLGTGPKTADDFRKALKKSGNKIGDYANNLLDKLGSIVSTEEIEVDLYNLTTAELTGKKEGGTTAEVFAGAKCLGLQKCTPEVGPQLREQYPDQPMGERLLIGMDPLTDSDGSLKVFGVERYGGGRWLDSYYGNPVSFWSGDYRWVFIRRK